ncbi:Fe-S-cluster redox domain-containing [Pseudomonas phage Psa21]|uniref:Ribosomal RNA large subunit methyltransferase N n=1 Tax=Pseudomonas phage Psa21 TaxID=2530023 RepID=A0A481W6N7_9CAUD|nr:Fe-S-cluster redox domain-containing [Pseudomonas phage Psa21]QBJ02924.1 ribosomal RNA large subunit methyltransferase N [Pseudomonas phage Psa21]
MELIFKQHISQLDQSVNFEHRFEDHPGMLEARYVRRSDDYFIVYLSSQTGCNQACRMCHLTATGQNKLRDVTIEEYWDQAERVLQYYATKTMARKVHFNFMARGEPLANKIFLDNADIILDGLAERASRYGLEYKFLVSTIFPQEMMNRGLTEIFTHPDLYPEIYYSVYSLKPEFRKRWIPKALNPSAAFAKLMSWQQATGKKPKIHYAFIRNENDDLADVAKICDQLDTYKLDVNWNIVRYNPPDGHSSQESLEGQINYLAGYIRRRLPKARVKVIPRVGTDVKASCGTFLK